MKQAVIRFLNGFLAAIILTGIVVSGNSLTVAAMAEGQASTELNSGNGAGLFADSTYVVSTHKLKVRSGPGKKHSIVTRLKRGTEVTLNKEEGDWWYVSYTGGSGYVNKKYLKEKSEVTKQNTYVARHRLRIRDQSSSRGKVLGKLNKGDEVVIVERKGKWARFDYNGQDGWVFRKYLKKKK